jgi:hypothetical protein
VCVCVCVCFVGIGVVGERVRRNVNCHCLLHIFQTEETDKNDLFLLCLLCFSCPVQSVNQSLVPSFGMVSYLFTCYIYFSGGKEKT